MMLIRNEQFALLGAERIDAAAISLAETLREANPDMAAGIEDDDFTRRVAAGLQRAAGLGLKETDTIMRFVAAWLTIGPGFDDYPLFRDAFAGEGPPDDRIDRAFAALTPRQWANAARRAGGPGIMERPLP